MILIGFDKENHEVFGGRPNLENRPDCNLGPTGPLVGAHPGQKRKKKRTENEKKKLSEKRGKKNEWKTENIVQLKNEKKKKR